MRKLSFYLFGISSIVAGVAYTLAARYIGDAGITVYPLLTTIRDPSVITEYEAATQVGHCAIAAASVSLVVHLFALNRLHNEKVGQERSSP